MERAVLKQSQLCGSWEMKERLGMGGFGHVYLYQHLVSSVMSPEGKNVDPRTTMCAFRLVLFPVLCLEQVMEEKIAVKLCRLELNSKNKDRWSREIQIMKK